MDDRDDRAMEETWLEPAQAEFERIHDAKAYAFPELVAALRGLYSGIQQDGGNRPYDTAMNMAREALAQADKIEKEQP